MSKKLCVLFSVIIVFSNCNRKSSNEKAYNIKPDSLNLYVAKASNQSLDSLSRLNYCIKSFNVLKSQKSSSTKNVQLFNISNSLSEINNEKEFFKVNKVLISESLKTKDTLNLSKSYNLLAYNYVYNEENDSAFYYFNKSEKLLFYTNDSLIIGKNYLGKAYLQYVVSDYYGCQQSSSAALTYLKNFKEDKKKYNALSYIGACANELKDYENSLIYHNKALSILENESNELSSHLISRTLNNIGFVYQNMHMYKESIDYFKTALKQKKIFEDYPDLYATLIDNYAYSKLKINDFNELPGLFYTSLNIREKNRLYQGMLINKIHLSEYYFNTKDTTNAKKFAYDALKLSKETKVSGDILASLKQLSSVDKKNSTQFYKEYIRLNDSVQNEERKAKDRFARIAYETDEIIQQKSELEVENRNLIYYLFASAGIFALLYVVRSQKAKNRELALKQQQQEVNEEIYNLMISQQATIEESRADEKKRMAQELHDGVLSKMFGTRLNLDSLNDAKDKDSIDRRYTYIQELKNIEQEIREISHDLSREKEKLINNFVGIVLNLLEEQKNSFTTELTYSFDKKIKWDMLNNTAKINLYRILQETLQNCNKYAKAKAIYVDFKSEDENIVLTVSDDGSGFDLNKKKKGIGLKNMVARAEESGGKYEINSVIDQGTSTTVIIPLNAPKPNQT